MDIPRGNAIKNSCWTRGEIAGDMFQDTMANERVLGGGRRRGGGEEAGGRGQEEADVPDSLRRCEANALAEACKR